MVDRVGCMYFMVGYRMMLGLLYGGQQQRLCWLYLVGGGNITRSVCMVVYQGAH